MAGPRQFPAIEARSLEGRRYMLPAELEGGRNLLVVAFERWQQSLVDGWMPALIELELRRRDIRVYEIPTISRAWSPLRWFIDGGMSRGIPDQRARARTLTAYTDVDRVLAALDLAGTGTIAVVLLDRAGRIVRQREGRFDEAKLRDLEAELG